MSKLTKIPPELTGVVLAGGLSSRLGNDKAELVLNGTETLLERSTEILLEATSKVLVVGRYHEKLNSRQGVECIADKWPGCGPVGGIATALRHCGADCLVLSCDLPFMNAPTLVRLVEAWEAKDEKTLLYAYKQKNTGKIENLAGIYSSNALPMLEKALKKKLLKIALVIPEELQEALEYCDEEALPFFNINYPADLQLAREYISLKNMNKITEFSE